MQRQLKSKYFGHGARNDWHGRSNDDGRHPHRELPPEGRRSSRRNELGPEPGPPPRGPGDRPGFGIERDRRPPRGMERDGPSRRPRPNGPPPE
jgi:hypothetical protein